MPYVYILKCADGSYYTGSTVDLEQRLETHRLGIGAHYTSKRLPVELAWCDEVDRIEDAFLWEKRIQGWSRAKKELLIAGRYDELSGWSRRSRPLRLASLAQ